VVAHGRLGEAERRKQGAHAHRFLGADKEIDDLDARPVAEGAKESLELDRFSLCQPVVPERLAALDQV
jgi:hypothetical protein